MNKLYFGWKLENPERSFYLNPNSSFIQKVSLAQMRVVERVKYFLNIKDQQAGFFRSLVTDVFSVWKNRCFHALSRVVLTPTFYQSLIIHFIYEKKNIIFLYFYTEKFFLNFIFNVTSLFRFNYIVFIEFKKNMVLIL